MNSAFLAACDASLRRYLRNVSYAYVQFRIKMIWPMFVQPPHFLAYQNDMLFCVSALIYGTPEFEAYFSYTCQSYYTRGLNMMSSVYNPCIFYKKELFQKKDEDPPERIIYLQTDSTAYCGNKVLCMLKDEAWSILDNMDVEHLNASKTIKSNGRFYHYDRKKYIISQLYRAKTMKILNQKDFITSNFISKRADGSYVAAVCHLDGTYSFNIASQVINPVKDNVTSFNDTTET